METIIEEAAGLGITLTPVHRRLFEDYARELVAWNAHTNLTAITDPEGVRVRHFLDSLTIVTATPITPGMRVADVGTGGGFPGLPLKIVYPEIRLTLIEATGKKLTFLRHVCETLGIEGVEFVHARAESAGHLPDLRAGFDLVLARAVARLPVLLEYLLPLARLGGRVIAMKGRTAHEETNASARALQLLGGHLVGITRVQLPNVDEPHDLVVVDKLAPTPIAYPRKPGQPALNPL